MSIAERASRDEVEIWSDMVATFHVLTGRNPDDEESRSMACAARQLADEKRAIH